MPGVAPHGLSIIAVFGLPASGGVDGRLKQRQESHSRRAVAGLDVVGRGEVALPARQATN